jgi:hypothetical protein
MSANHSSNLFFLSSSKTLSINSKIKINQTLKSINNKYLHLFLFGFSNILLYLSQLKPVNIKTNNLAAYESNIKGAGRIDFSI